MTPYRAPAPRPGGPRRTLGVWLELALDVAAFGCLALAVLAAGAPIAFGYVALLKWLGVPAVWP